MVVQIDSVGTEVATLQSDIKAAGSHQVAFDSGSLPFGANLYTLNAGSLSATRKLLLVKQQPLQTSFFQVRHSTLTIRVRRTWFPVVSCMK